MENQLMVISGGLYLKVFSSTSLMQWRETLHYNVDSLDENNSLISFHLSSFLNMHHWCFMVLSGLFLITDDPIAKRSSISSSEVVPERDTTMGEKVLIF